MPNASDKSPASLRERAAKARRLAPLVSPRDAAELEKIALHLDAQADAADAVLAGNNHSAHDIGGAAIAVNGADDMRVNTPTIG